MKTQLGKYLLEKWHHEGFQKYLVNTGWSFIARIFSLIISFFATAVIARHLGPENYGQLSYAVSFTSIFSFIAVLGIDSVLYRELIQYPERKKQFLGSALAIRLSASVVAIALCLIFAFIAAKDGVSVILISIISLTFVFNSFQILGYEILARVQSRYSSIVSLWIVLILNVLKILIVISGKGVIYLAFVLLLESVLYAISYIYLYEFKFGEKIAEWCFDRETAIKLLKDSWPMIFVSAFTLIYSRIDQVMIGHMIDALSVGLYDAAVRISEVWYFIPGLVVSSLFPAIVNAKNLSLELYENRLGKLFVLLFFISVVIALPTTLLAGWIMKLLYGEEFLSGVVILQIYIWSGIGVSLNTVLSSYLVAENFRKILFVTSMISMLSNIVLNIVLIPQFGIVGSAWATSVSYFLGPASIIFFQQPRRQLLRVAKNIRVY